MSNSNPQQGSTIEDKLNKMLWELYNVRFPKQVSTAVPEALNDILSLITTETKKARINELEHVSTKGTCYYTDTGEAISINDRIQALQKEPHDS